MAGKPRVTDKRLAQMLDILEQRPGFKGKITLEPNGGIKIDTTETHRKPVVKDEFNHPPELTDDELAAFGSAA